jgi:hypothetical protein
LAVLLVVLGEVAGVVVEVDALLSVVEAAAPALVVVAAVAAAVSVEVVPEVASARGAVEVVPQCSEIMRTSLTLKEFPADEPVEAVGV